MEDQIVKVIVLEHYNLISEIEEVQAELGDPNCKLTNPYTIKSDSTLEPFLIDVTIDSEIMLGSDKIITIVEPTPTLLEKYQDLIK